MDKYISKHVIPTKDLSFALLSCDPESKYLMDMIRLAPHLQTRRGSWWQVGFFRCSELIDIRKKNAVLVLAGFETYLTFHSQRAAYIHKAQQGSECHWAASETRGKPEVSPHVTATGVQTANLNLSRRATSPQSFPILSMVF